MVSNTVENIAIGAGSAAATYAAVEAWRRASERTVLDGKTVRSTRVDAARLSADADTFQFKSGGDRSGVTDRLAGVKTWNAAAAGKVMVYEYADGRQVIADGHQRTGLAKRLMSDGHAPIKMDALVLREADGWSPRDVRAYAAIKNMHESSGNALDMAKIMRERPDLVTSSLPMSDAKVREASALSRLSDKAFGMVVGGGVEPGAAAAVGEAVKDATRHADMIAEMSEAKVRGAQHARLYVQQALSAPSVAETTSSLFGEETHTRSLIKERSAVLDRALTSLKSNRKLFGMLEREADTIEAAGNKLARQANSSNADTAGRLSALVEKLATQRGNVSKMLDDAARAVASGEPAAKAGRAFLKSVQGAMEQGGIRALVGDAPLPMAASGGMQRMVEKQAKPQRSFVVHDIDGNTLEVFRSSKEAHAFALARNREQPVLNNSTKLWVREAAQSEVAPKGQSSFLPAPTTKEQIAAAAKTAGKPGVMQQDVGGLFGDGMKQMDLVDEARKNAARDANVKLVQDKWLADRGITSLDQVKSMTQPERENLAREWEKVSKPIDRKGPVGWSDAARQASAEVRAANAGMTDQEMQQVKRAIVSGRGESMAKGHAEIIARATNAQVSELDTAAAVARRANAVSDHDFNRNSAYRQAFRDRARVTSDAAAAAQMQPAKPFEPLPDPAPTKGKGSRKAKHDADMARIHQEIRDTLGPRGDGKHRYTDGTPITKETEATRAEKQRIADGTKRIGDTYKAPAPAEPSKADAFASGKGPMAAAKVKAALQTQVRHNGKEFMTRAALVEREVAQGATVQTIKIGGKPERVLMGKDGAFLDTRNITKAGLDYAEHLASKPTSGLIGFQNESTQAAAQAGRVNTAKSRGVALPGEAKPVVPVKAGKAKGAPKPTAKGAKILDLYHGTAAPKFDTFKSGNSDGMRGGAPYLTSDYKAAERYAKMAAERTGGTPRVLRVQVEAEKVMSTGSNWMKQSQISGLMKRVLGREVGMKAFDDFARTSVTGPPGNKGAQGATVYKSLADAVGGANALNERLAKAGVTAVKFDQPAAFWGNTSYNIRDAVAVLDPSRARIVDQDYRPAPKAKAPSAAPKAPKAPPVAQLRADAAKAGIPAAAQMKKPELMSLKKAGKFMGPLAIIGAGAVAFDGTRNQAHAAGKSESAANLDAAGAAAIASGSVAAIGYGIGKVVQAAARVAPVAGKVLSRAVPAVAIAAAGYEIGKGAVAGFKKDGLAGAAKGAGVGAMDFATLGAYSHFASKGQMGRLTPEQEAQFASADQGYRAGQEQQKAAATTDDGSGWTDQARIAAYMKRIANAGGTPQNMPYGGKPRQTPASSGTWAQANVAVPGGPAKGKN